MTKFDRSKISNFMHWLGLLMVATYIGLGIYILLTKKLMYLDQNVKTVFSFFFFAFGLFRGVHWLQKHKDRKYVEDSDYRGL
jgi:hypothetical protein